MGVNYSKSTPIDPVKPGEIRKIVEENRLNHKRFLERENQRELEILRNSKESISKEVQKYIIKEFSKSPKKPPEVYEFKILTKFQYLTKNQIRAEYIKLLRGLFEPEEWLIRIHHYQPATEVITKKMESYHKVKLTPKSKHFTICKLGLAIESFVDTENDVLPKHLVYRTPKKIFREKYCAICKDNHPDLLFHPCAHHVVCSECNSKKELKTCPLCTAVIVTKIREEYIPVKEEDEEEGEEDNEEQSQDEEENNEEQNDSSEESESEYESSAEYGSEEDS